MAKENYASAEPAQSGWVERPSIMGRHYCIDGLDWDEVPRPWRWHRCQTQAFTIVEHSRKARCACGGVSFDGGPWRLRNTRDAR